MFRVAHRVSGSSLLSPRLDGNPLSPRTRLIFSLNFGGHDAKGETDKAVAAYAKAVELAPGMTPARVNLGAQLLQSGRLQDAEAVREVARPE